MGKGYRQGRLGEEIKKLISTMLLREIKDPRLSESMISVSGVDVTKDSSYATCYITILYRSNDEEKMAEEEERVLEGLSSAKGLIRKEISKQIKLHHDYKRKEAGDH